MCIILRPVKEDDCDLLFKWVNEKEVRQMSFDTTPILYENHKDWFYKSLLSSLSHLFIICADEKPVGQIRIDIEKNEGIISYSIDKNYRGHGYGSEVLQKIIGELKKQKIDVCKLTAKVKYCNEASIRAFQKASYNSKEHNGYIEFYKYIF